MINDNAIPHCGLELGCCSRQIPYDLVAHDKMVYQQGRADAIEEYRLALHFKYEDNKKISDAINELGINFANLDLEEIDTIAEQLKEQKNE